ncbi:TRAP transporter small permease [uncultured Cohaesibacter sp.]|uniref:TRAP transporter small permease n=1 Tax=uncultured Cohaesibacter sp. TaxID=1002546 RepID=UPI0029C645F0|nr:TRAP transporter small permease [uncultured Cohaesibacter sp.]
MTQSEKSTGARGFLELLLKGTAHLSGIVLVAVMLLVTVSVIFRYAFNQPILGSQELVQMGMVVIVMLAMPFTASQSMHIRVDILDNWLGRIGRYLSDLLARLLGISVLTILVNKAADKAVDAYIYEDVTNMLQLPVWLSYASIALGMACYALVLVVQLALQIGNWKNYDE